MIRDHPLHLSSCPLPALNYSGAWAPSVCQLFPATPQCWVPSPQSPFGTGAHPLNLHGAGVQLRSPEPDTGIFHFFADIAALS